MKILVTGASGFVGRHVVAEMLGRGHQVVAASRSPRLPANKDSQRIETLACDLSSESGLLQLDGMAIDAVVHLAASMSGSREEQYATTVRGTVHLLDAMRTAGIRRLVGVSSVAVLDYVKPAPMSVIDEETPLLDDEDGVGVYAKIKAQQEKLFKVFAAEPDNHCVILRPGLVFDDSYLINAHAGIVKGALGILAEHEGEVPVVAVAGVARGVVDCLERPIPSGEVIHLVDDGLPDQHAYLSGLRRRGLLRAEGMSLSWQTLARFVATLRGIAVVAGLQHKLPDAFLPQGFAARLKPFRFSNAKAKRLLAWAPSNRFF